MLYSESRKVKTVAPLSESEVMPMGNSSKSDRKEVSLLTAFEAVQTILGFGVFCIALIGLSYKIFKNYDKKK